MLRSPRAALLLTPLLFAAHVAEEAPGYVRWFNSIARPPLPEAGFVVAQAQPLAAAAFLAAMATWTNNRWAALILWIWCAHFFFANAFYHLAASAFLFTYSPGLVTGTLFYLPFFYWLTGQLTARGMAVWALVLLVFFVSLPSFIQTYLVVFEGRRFY